jgi:hypothetical protein
MPCILPNPIERRARRFWCAGGPAMSISEVAFAVCMTVEGLRAALSHIHDLSYVTIRLAGLRILMSSNSSEARVLGFLVDADPFEILDADAEEAERLAEERDELLAWIMRTA